MKHTLSCIVKDHPGVLARIAGSFAEKGINISSLAVCEAENPAKSRMTMVVECPAELVSDIVDHLKQLDDIIEVEDLVREDMIERELMLIKVRALSDDIPKITQIVEIFRATIIGMGREYLIIEMTDTEYRINALVQLLKPFGILTLTGTGRVAVKHHEEIP